jgi:diguanylate cyclase (GGDEF)-like protein/PAS domain S-box-containing protein
MDPTTWWVRLLDSSSDLLTVHEADGSFRFANAASERILGIPPGQLVGDNPYRLLHPDDQGAIIEAMLRLRDDPEGTHEFRARARHMDGSWRWLEAVARNQLSDPALKGVVVSSRDVTDRLAAERDLQSSEATHRQLVQRAPFGMAVVAADNVIQFANPAGFELVGLEDLDQVHGRQVTDFVHPDDQAILVDAVRRALHERTVPEPFECRIHRPDGSESVVMATAIPYQWEGRPAALLVAQDVTQLRLAEEERHRADERSRLLLTSSAEGILGLDTDARLTFINPAATNLLGLNPSTALGRVGHELYHHTRPDGTPYPAADCPCVAVAREGRSAAADADVFWRADGTPVPVDYRATPLLTDRLEGAVLTFRDVSERLQAEQQLAAQAEFLNSVLNALSAQTGVVDAHGTLIAVNSAWTRFMQERGGRPERCGPGVSVFDVLDRVIGHDRAAADEVVEGLQAVLEGRTREFNRDVTCSWSTGAPLYFSLQVVPLDAPEGGAVLGYTDITARKALEVQAAHRALHDELTSLPNRALLLDRLEHALRERDAAPLALLFVDLDHFKLVNDGYGHEAGDRVLQELAARLRSAVRPSDTVARLAGDEFVILCERLPFLTEAYRLAQRILGSIAEPFSLDGTQLTLGASIGIAEAEDRDLTPDDLLRAADQAMFEAKARGRNQFAVYDDGVHQRSVERVEQALALRRLVEEDRLTVHYQPVVDLHDGRITGVEALLRWRGDEILPDAATAVALAEEVGLIVEIGGRVLREALGQAATFRQADGSVLPLSVNLAPQQLDGFLVDTVTDAAEAAAYPLASLTLELTERSVMTDVRASVDVLRELRSLGVRIAIDDFGVGYSSLSYLRDLPLDILKIDRDFVQALSSDGGDDRIIRAIIQLARALELHVVAEGVERDEQRLRLLELGCDRGQGFLFSAAEPAETIRSLTT